MTLKVSHLQGVPCAAESARLLEQLQVQISSKNNIIFRIIVFRFQQILILTERNIGGHPYMTTAQREEGGKKYLKFADKQYITLGQRGEGV